ncbi:MAG: DUF559 domain-containing protein [Ekhidna sp.]|nr:DUF559 domain-containing protein [Ekhidna sp.]
MSNKQNNQLARVFHFDLQGKREEKYDFLDQNSLQSIDFKELPNMEPNHFFVPKDFETQKSYDKGFSIAELFPLNNVGIVTARDQFTIHNTKEEVESTIDEFLSLENEEARTRFNLGKDVRDWKVSYAKSDLENHYPQKGSFTKLSYRPFDHRWTFFTGKSKGFHCYPRNEVMQHVLKRENVGLITNKPAQGGSDIYSQIFITKNITDQSIYSAMKNSPFICPLYRYNETNGQQAIEQSTERTPNLNQEIVTKIAKTLGLKFVPEKFPSPGGVPEGRGGKKVTADQSGKKRSTQNYMSLPYNPKLKERARQLRKAGNLPEVLFWKQVKNKKFKGFDFDRQKIIGNYIVDFLCTNCNVVIEIDGSSHDNKAEYDAERDAFLENLGLSVVHIPVADVMNNMSGVMEMLFNHPALKDIPPKETLSNHPALKGTPPGEGNLTQENTFAPIDLLDYIYAVLHSPAYREKYKVLLKIDFPRVPYPKDRNTFWQLVKLGEEIRQIHLLESPAVEKYITHYPIEGDNTVSKPAYKDGKVYINSSQYFDKVPPVAWEFYIGGYQPAQKWLKDRKGRQLTCEDIAHYQKIIAALTETNRLMGEVGMIDFEKSQ